MSKRLSGKVAIVTGGASGIGAATCRLFAQEGAKGVVVADINEELGMAVANEIQGRGSDAFFILLVSVKEDTTFSFSSKYATCFTLPFSIE